MTEHSVAAPLGVRNPAGYSSRLLAALIDGGLMLAMVHVIGFAYVWLALPTEPAVPTPVTVSMWALPALYVIATGVLGRTLGMMAAGLRITGADGVHVARLRLLGRAALLCGVVAMIVALATWWLWPLLLLAYFLLMLTNPRHQLPTTSCSGPSLSGGQLRWRARRQLTESARSTAICRVQRPRCCSATSTTSAGARAALCTSRQCRFSSSV